MKGEVTQRKGKFNSKPAPISKGVRFETLVKIKNSGGSLNAQNNGISGSGESLLNESSIRDLFREELSVYGRNFKSFEHPQNFALLAEEWSIENGLLTPTLKLKREVVEKKFKDQIESLY